MIPFLDISGLSIGYSKKQTLFEDITIRLHCGKITGILGPNGIGKSTLLKTIAGLLPPLKGSVIPQGLPQDRDLCAFVPAQPWRASNFSVEDTVSTGRYRYTNWLGLENPEGKRVIEQVLEKTGISYLAQRNSADLSDGEFHRVAIARALVQDTPLILLDEPTAFLDIANKRSTILLLKKIAVEESKGILFSTHDLSLAMQHCDLFWIMTPDKEIFCGTPSEMKARGIIDLLY
jgi:iron complex transport system ATP-binding protein